MQTFVKILLTLDIFKRNVDKFAFDKSAVFLFRNHFSSAAVAPWSPIFDYHSSTYLSSILNRRRLPRVDGHFGANSGAQRKLRAVRHLRRASCLSSPYEMHEHLLTEGVRSFCGQAFLVFSDVAFNTSRTNKEEKEHSNPPK